MTPAESAAERVDYQLGIQRAPEHRSFGRDGLSGPDIDCARTEGHTSRGGWTDEPPSPDAMSEQDWIDWYQHMALQECVHEALEWFHVDGQPWLDPHILMNKIEVREIVHRAWRELCELRRLNYGPDHESRPLSS